MVVKTDSQRVSAVRQLVMELLLARCPNPKKVKEVAEEVGVEAPPLRFSLENEYCILCGLCVRTCAEVVQAYALDFEGSGVNKGSPYPSMKLRKTALAVEAACLYVPRKSSRCERLKMPRLSILREKTTSVHSG
jgi:ferredoxin